MKYTIVFLAVSAVLVAKATATAPWGLVLYWPAGSFALVGLAYGGIGPKIFGKKPDGGLNPLSCALLLPYLLCAWGLWHMWRWTTREPAYHVLYDGVTIGRRLLAAEYPDDITTIVDLTCEFPKPSHIKGKRRYMCVPVLDAGRPGIQALRELTEEIRKVGRGVYIHCANGHGRTGTVATALLLMAGTVDSPEEAQAYLRQRRPKAYLNWRQQQALNEFAEMVISQTHVTRSHPDPTYIPQR